MPLRVIGPAMLLAGFLLPTSPLGAQSLLWSSVTGTVTDPAGAPVGQALVTLSTQGGNAGTEIRTDGSGRFSFSLVAPGTYQLRAEALGYRPVVARGVSVQSGADTRVELAMAVAAPPVSGIDTVDAGAVSSARGRTEDTELSRAHIDAVPTRFGDLSSLIHLAPRASRSGGVAGLPGSMSLAVADGLPVHGTRHPLAREGGLPQAGFPASTLAGLTVRQVAPDVDWHGSAAGYATLTTPTGPPGGSFALEAAWSGDPLWSSSELDLSAPSLTSFQAAGGASLEVSPDGARLGVSADVLRQQSPLAPRLSEADAGAFAGIDPGLVASLVEPSVETLSRYSALARFEGRAGETGRMFLRGSAGYLLREFEGPGPVTLERAAVLPEETIDYSFAGGYTTAYRPGLLLEVRAGVSGSDRTFEPAENGATAAYVASVASPLGVLPHGTGASARTDVVLVPAAHLSLGVGTLSFGAALRASKHTLEHDVAAELLFSDPAALLAGEGVALALAAPDADFSTREYGAFAQYGFEPTPRVSLSFGARYDRESVSGADATLNGDWLAASGVRNDAFPGGFDQLGARGSLTWDALGDGSTLLSAAASVHHGDVDVGAFHEVFARDVGATATTFVGSGLSWPMATIPAGATTLPTLTLLGPDTRAPRSLHSSVGLTRRLAAGWSLSLEGVYRRTDFLMRRRNLNVPVMPSARDAYGRDVFGTLQQTGSLVTALGDDARRFPAFQQVWALDPDGWSEYVGGTVSLEYTGTRGRLLAAYTRSETTDNWVGAAAAAPDAELGPRLPGGNEWTEGISDYDAPDRAVVSGSWAVGPVTASGVYHYRSGLPFTPGYRLGVDANGDGSFRNDVAFVDPAVVDGLFGAWSCLEDQTGAFGERNSCRGPASHTLDLRLQMRLATLGGRDVSVIVDGLDIVESGDGVIDTALLLVDPAGTITSSGGVITVPVVANPGFGQVLYPSTRGRMLRVGVRIGG